MLLPALALGVITGCATPTEVVRSGEASSRTGGIALMYADRNMREGRHRRYELDADGAFRVGSGAAAQRGATDWSGTATPEQIAVILNAARSAGIFDDAPACEPRLVDGHETIFTTIEWAMPKGDPRGKGAYHLEGICPALMPLRDAFEKAALVRFNKELDALPEPGRQPARR
ncbi:MAG: hypothetical protein SGJ11_00455 [Phycisphaerae bacterium]|nr:hypothetical protein [Phycisphaerae bacterium]